MSEHHFTPGLLTGVKLITDQLSNEELVRMYMNWMEEGDPRDLSFYEKIKGLCSGPDMNTIHESTWEVFNTILDERLGM